jgi:hypothetical protein
MKKQIIFAAVAAVGITSLIAAPVTQAALTDSSLFSQQITAGTLSTAIRNSGDTADVAAPNVPFTALSVSTACQTSTGTYGTNTERIYVDNPGASATGWTLALAATGGATAKWVSGSNNYAFNSAAGSGCTSGQLTINPAAGSVNPVSPATTTGITLGSSASFVSGTTDSITLVNAAAASDDIWRGYILGIGASQKVPANTPVGSYSIDMTQTVAAQ